MVGDRRSATFANCCALCPTTDKLDVHHRSYARKDFAPEHLVILCDVCHGRHHGQLTTLAYISRAPAAPLSGLKWLEK